MRGHKPYKECVWSTPRAVLANYGVYPPPEGDLKPSQKKHPVKG